MRDPDQVIEKTARREGLNKLIVYGTGWTTVIKMVEAINRRELKFELVGFINDLPEFRGKSILGHPVLGPKEIIPHFAEDPDVRFYNNIHSTCANRMKIAGILETYGCKTVSLIHPDIDMFHVRVGNDCLIQEGVILGANVTMGKLVVLGHNSAIGHDAVISDGVIIGPAATVCGRVKLEEGCYLGAGSTILPDRILGQGSIVGGGATVIHDVPVNATVAGSPAREIKTH